MAIELRRDGEVHINGVTLNGTTDSGGLNSTPAVTITGAEVRFVNTESGRVIASAWASPAIAASGDGVTIENEAGGVIRAAQHWGTAITASASADTLVNHGLIAGHVRMGEGDDLVRSSGSLQGGYLFLEGGDDRLEFSGGQIVANGGAGEDTLALNGQGAVLADGFERLEVGPGVSRVDGISGLTSITLASGVGPTFRRSDNPLADLALTGGYASIGFDSSLNDITGRDAADYFEVLNGGGVNNVRLGGGDDTFRYTWSSFFIDPDKPVIRGVVDGGEGRNTVGVILSSHRTLDLSIFRNFSVLNAGTFSSDTTGGRLLHADGYKEIWGDTDGFMTLDESDSPDARLVVGANGGVTLTATTVVGKVGYAPGYTSIPEQADDRLSVTLVNHGVVRGAVALYIGDDLYDGRLGRAGGPISGYTGNDTLLGGAEDNFIDGGAGADLLDGGGGADVLEGGSANDRLLGGSGDDVLRGGSGDDVLDGGVGGDRLEGGAGDDVYLVDATADMVVEAAGEGVDQIRATAELVALADHTEQLVYIGPDRIIGFGNGFDNSMAGGGEADFLSGFDGADLLNGWAGDDEIHGGAGDDIIIGGTGADLLYGGEGADTLALAGTAGDYTVARSGDAWLVTGGATDTVSGFEKVYVGGETIPWDAFTTRAFDGLRYIASHPDLLAAFGPDAAAGRRHWEEAGRAEGRSLTGFDPLVYAASHPDVFAAFGQDRQALTRHYIEYGFGEGRKHAGFDPVVYAASNLDAARAFGYDREALTAHYLEEGLRQGRGASGFDPLLYAASNPDVAQAFGADGAAITRHWIDYGSLEGREPASFDPRRYAAANPDVALAFGADLAAATLHYIQEGIGQGRAVSGFDAVAYLLSYDDLGSAGLGADGAFDHWLSDGVRQNRVGDRLFGREQAGYALTTAGVADALCEAGDRDWFEFSARAGDEVRLGFLGDGVDGVLTVHRADGGLVTTFAADAAGGEEIGFTADMSGAYYLTVQTQNAGTGTYQLDLLFG